MFFETFNLPTRSKYSSGPCKFAFRRLNIGSIAFGRKFGAGVNACRRYFLLEELDFRFGAFIVTGRRLDVSREVADNLKVGENVNSLTAVESGGFNLVFFLVGILLR